jgi:hypothetical protein
MPTTNPIATTFIGLAIAGVSFSALASPADYQLEPVAAEVKNTPGVELKVRLTHKPTGKPVVGAIVFRSRLDMSPENMAEHTAPVQPLPSEETGEFRFKADFGMAGQWALKLMVKVPGESETVQGAVIFRAKD